VDFKYLIIVAYKYSKQNKKNLARFFLVYSIEEKSEIAQGDKKKLLSISTN